MYVIYDRQREYSYSNAPQGRIQDFATGGGGNWGGG